MYESGPPCTAMNCDGAQEYDVGNIVAHSVESGCE